MEMEMVMVMIEIEKVQFTHVATTASSTPLDVSDRLNTIFGYTIKMPREMVMEMVTVMVVIVVMVVTIVMLVVMGW